MILIFGLFFVIGLLIPEAEIKRIMREAGPFGPILLIFCFWLSNFFAPLSGSPFLFAGFYLYGHQVVIYATISAVLASITNFLVAKRWGRPFVVKLAGESALQKVDGVAKDFGLVSLFFIRVLFKEIHDVVSYAFGLTSLKFWPYFVVSTLGMIPYTVFWYFLAEKIPNATVFTLFSWVMVYVPLSVYLVFRQFKKKKKDKNS